MFTADDLISAYSRADALEDGTLIDVTDTAREAGFRYPVAMTRAAFEANVEWTPADTHRTGLPQDEQGRLWDVLSMALFGIRAAKRSSSLPEDMLRFVVYVVPRDGSTRRPRPVTLKLCCGPNDDGSPCITILEPDED
jgi:hypothetical protein